jgi:hypothetical protein
MTSKANTPEIVRKSAEACAELIPSKFGERYQKQFSHFCKWKSENNVKKITEEVMLAGLFFRFGLNGCMYYFICELTFLVYTFVVMISKKKKKTIATVNKLDRNYNLTFFPKKTCN